jgi:hypothetical protein
MPLGIFTESLTGDGVKRIQVRMFHEISLFWWSNDTVAPVLAANIGDPVYIKDDQTVSLTSTGASALGIAFQVDSVLGVLVYSTYRPAAPAVAADEEPLP